MEIGDVHTLPGSRPLPPEQEADRSSRTTLQADAPDSAETAQPADSPPVSPIDPNEDQRPHQPSTSHNGQNIVLKTEPQTIDKTMPHKHASYTKLVVDWWFWELVGAIVSILALASIVIVLLVYDGNGMPKLPRDVTLNAIISVLATTTNGSLLLAVSNAICQTKWIWLKEQRQLYDVQMFDDASRGPWGAFVLLFRLRAWHMPSLGAFVMLLSLALEPFVQLLATYPLREVYIPSNQVVSSRAPIPPSTNNYDSSDQVSLTTAAYTEAMLTNLYSVKAVPWPQPTCSSGNCTWPEFESLGFCNKCVNMTKEVRMTCTDDVGWNCTIKFPNGQEANANNQYGIIPSYLMASWILNYAPGPMLPDSGGLGYGEISQYVQGNYAGFTNPILAMGRVVMDPSAYVPGTSIEAAFVNGSATECALTLCAKSLKLSEQAGKTSLQVVDTLPGEYTTCTGACAGASGYINASFIHLPYSDNFTRSSNVTFPTSLSGLIDYASYYLTGNFTVLPDLTGPGSGGSTTAYGSSTIDAVQQIPDFSNFMDRLAASLTVALLQQTSISPVSLMTGDVGTVEQYVHVRWGWIALPATVVALGISFLALAMVETHRQKIKVWKVSSLALLYHGLDRPPEHPALLNKTSEMDHNARDFKVRLGRTAEDGWRLLRVGRSHGKSHGKP